MKVAYTLKQPDHTLFYDLILRFVVAFHHFALTVDSGIVGFGMVICVVDF